MKARRLKGLRVTRVDLVEKGANQHAHVTLLKNENGAPGPVEKGQCVECPSCGKRLPLGYGDGGTELPNYCGECGAEIKLTASGGKMEKSMTDTTKTGEPTVEQLKADLAKALEGQKAAEEKAAKLEKAAKPAEGADSTADVLKSLAPEARAIVEKSQADAAKAATEAAEAKALVLKMEDEAATREFEARAALIKGVPGFNAKDGGALLKSLSRVVTKADEKPVLEQVETILKAAAEAIAKGKLFSEAGSSTSGAAGGAGTDPMTQLGAMAAERVTKGEAKTEQEAMALVLDTEDGARLYQKHMERQRAVRREVPAE